MSDARHRVAEFRGPVRVLRAPGETLDLTLAGHTASACGAALELAFAGATSVDLPEVLDDVRVERCGPGAFDITSGARSFRLEARSVHVHLDVGREFYAAIPGRPVPLMRRLLLSAALAIASSRAGLALLRGWRR
ncbi:MAG TPA: hypothetical protein VKQ31_02550 [Steroidobacteraceae bacterium]|nr:hypothetical protein [Steroidobacteraceae bacterium]